MWEALQGTTLGWPLSSYVPQHPQSSQGCYRQGTHHLNVFLLQAPAWIQQRNPKAMGAACSLWKSCWLWGKPQHAGTAAPGAAHPCLSAKPVSFEHWCFWQLPAAKHRAQTHPTAQLVSSYLQVINKSFSVYCNHSAKTQTESIAVTTSKAVCSLRSGKRTFWVLPSEKGVYRTLDGPGSSSCDSCACMMVSRTNSASCQSPCADEQQQNHSLQKF